MGLSAAGVGGMRLKKGDRIIYAGVVMPGAELITLTANGFGKRTVLADYPSQGRNGGGIVTHKLTARTGPISTALLLNGAEPNETLLAVTRKGVPKLLPLNDLPQLGRSVQGKPVLELIANDPVVLLQRVTAENEPPPTAPGDSGQSSPSGASPPPSPTAAPTSGANGGAPPPRQQLTKPKSAAIPTKLAGAINQEEGAKPAREPAAIRPTEQESAPTLTRPARTTNREQGAKQASKPATTRAKQNGREVAEPTQGRTALKRTGANTDDRRSATATHKPATVEAAPTRPTPTKRAQPQTDRPTAKPMKKAEQSGQVVQPSLLAVEETPAPLSPNSRAKKVERVVSVPAGQGRKKAPGAK